VLEWLQELLYLMNNNISFTGDGRDLKKIGEDLGLDEASLLTVVARTPQKSALKLFRLLYPTIGSRAGCISISEMAQEQLENIYCEFTSNLFNFPVSLFLYRLCTKSSQKFEL
jgi:hypothetical protein